MEEWFISIPAGKKENTHSKRKAQTHTEWCAGGVVWVIVSGTFVSLIGMGLCKLLYCCGVPNSNNKKKKKKKYSRSVKERRVTQQQQQKKKLSHKGWISLFH